LAELINSGMVYKETVGGGQSGWGARGEGKTKELPVILTSPGSAAGRKRGTDLLKEGKKRFTQGIFQIRREKPGKKGKGKETIDTFRGGENRVRRGRGSTWWTRMARKEDFDSRGGEGGSIGKLQPNLKVRRVEGDGESL